MGIYCIAYSWPFGLYITCINFEVNTVNKLNELQDIKQMIMNSSGCSNHAAVLHIGYLVNRSPKTVYEWLSEGRQEIPDQVLELLKLKLIN